jgi:TetR/AcrR family transcriptional regulator, transcriptional repressor for nem operon
LTVRSTIAMVDRTVKNYYADRMARPRQFDEERVLRSVRDQFWAAGFAATSLDDLMRVSGLGKGSLYAAFGDKHQLYLRALRSYNDANAGALRNLLESTPRAVDGLRSFVMLPVRAADEVATRRGCFMANSTSELAAADPEIKAEATRTYEQMTAVVAEFVVRARDEGDLPADTDAIETARALLTAELGIVFMGRTGLDMVTLTATAQGAPAPPGDLNVTGGVVVSTGSSRRGPRAGRFGVRGLFQDGDQARSSLPPSPPSPLFSNRKPGGMGFGR